MFQCLIFLIAGNILQVLATILKFAESFAGILDIGTSTKLDIGMTKGNMVDIGNRNSHFIQGIDPPTLPAHAPLRMYIALSDNEFLILWLGHFSEAMIIPKKIIRIWEKRLPGLNSGWTHWHLEADGYAIGLIAGHEITKALELVKESYGRFRNFNVHRARYSETGELERERGATEIYDFINDEITRANGEWK